MSKRLLIHIVIISVIFTSTLVYGIKAAADREAAGAPSIASLTHAESGQSE